MKIDADVKSIQKLKDYFFVVPDYQREYVWNPDDQVEQFLIDIDNEFDPDINGQSSYFIGSIIIVERNDKAFDVIDGQQRLTTIVLTLCAIRDLMKQYKDEHGLNRKAEEYFKMVQELLYEFNIDADETKSRLELQYEDSKDYLNKLITEEEFTEEKTSSIKKMKGAYRRIFRFYENLLVDSVESFLDFVRYFLTKVELVVIESGDLSSALKIFETINQRGVGLNAMDLLKNLIFSQANQKDFEKIKNIWKDIIRYLEECKEDQKPLRFLRYFLMARYANGILREDDIYKWIISKEGKSAINYEQEPLKFAKEIKRGAKKYSEFVQATEKLGDTEKYKHVSHIGFINKYRSRQHILLLLALPEIFTETDIDYLAQQIESVLFYNVIRGVQAKYNERTFSGWAQKIRRLVNREELEAFVQGTMFEFVNKDAASFKNEFLVKTDWNLRPLYREKFILGRIEEFIRSQVHYPSNAISYYDNLQIEHIFPQTPKDGKLPESFENAGDKYWLATYRLGNITLIESPINQALNHSNDLEKEAWYRQKLEEYQKSEILLTRLLNPTASIGQNTALNQFRYKYNLSFDNWTYESVEVRQDTLLRLACEVWRVGGKKIEI